jgi:hypothetical protein
MGRRIIRRIGDWLVWLALLAVGFAVGHWWSEHGHDWMARVAAWSERPAGPEPAIEKAELGPRKRAYLDRIERAAGKAEGAAAGPGH